MCLPTWINGEIKRLWTGKIFWFIYRVNPNCRVLYYVVSMVTASDTCQLVANKQKRKPEVIIIRQQMDSGLGNFFFLLEYCQPTLWLFQAFPFSYIYDTSMINDKKKSKEYPLVSSTPRPCFIFDRELNPRLSCIWDELHQVSWLYWREKY